MKELDLHGTKHKDVPKKVDEYIWKEMEGGAQEARIVTGNSTMMKSIVKETLEDYDMKSKESMLNTGVLIVSLK